MYSIGYILVKCIILSGVSNVLARVYVNGVTNIL